MTNTYQVQPGTLTVPPYLTWNLRLRTAFIPPSLSLIVCMVRPQYIVLALTKSCKLFKLLSYVRLTVQR